MYKKGDTGTITFGNGTTSKVVITSVQTYPSSGMPADIFFTYQESETNRPLKHPDFGDSFPLPEGLADQVFTKD